MTAVALGEPVELAKVDAALERQAREHEQDDAGLLRTRVGTLVVVTADADAAGEALRLVEALEGRNPSRCVVLVVRPPEDGPGVRAWARVARREGRGADRVWDEVVVEAAVPPAHLSAVVLPLLLPDTPVFTWWRGTPPLGTEVCDELLAVSDRLIVDSAGFDEPVADLARLARALGSLPPPSDCVWGRITPWRELLAAPFDAPPLRAALDRVTGVRIAGV